MFTALSPASTAEGRIHPERGGGDGCRECAAAPVGINVVDAGVLPTVYFSLMEKNIGRVTVEMATLKQDRATVRIERALPSRPGVCRDGGTIKQEAASSILGVISDARGSRSVL